MILNLRKKICKILCPKKQPNDIVLVFPVDTKQKKVLLIEEYIHAYDKKIWKFCSGRIDKQGKTPQQHAQEELAEELGMEASHFQHFYTFEKIFTSRKQHCFIAKNPKKMDHPPVNPDTDFITQTKWVSSEELWHMIDHQEIIWKESVLVALNILRSL